MWGSYSLQRFERIRNVSVPMLGVPGLSHAVRGAITPKSNLTVGPQLTQPMAGCRSRGSASQEVRRWPLTAVTLTYFFFFILLL